MENYLFKQNTSREKVQFSRTQNGNQRKRHGYRKCFLSFMSLLKLLSSSDRNYLFYFGIPQPISVASKLPESVKDKRLILFISVLPGSSIVSRT